MICYLRCKYCSERWLVSSDNIQDYEFYVLMAKVERLNHEFEGALWMQSKKISLKLSETSCS